MDENKIRETDKVMGIDEVYELGKSQLVIVCGEFISFAELAGVGVMPTITPDKVYEGDKTRGIVAYPEGYVKSFIDGRYYNNDYVSMVRLGDNLVRKHTGVVLTNSIPLFESIDLHAEKYNTKVTLLMAVEKDKVVDVTKDTERFYGYHVHGIRLLDKMRLKEEDEENED